MTACKPFALAALLAAASPLAAQAATTLLPDENSGLCFERTYSAAEMRHQTALLVQKMTARIDRSIIDGKERTTVTIGIEMRKGVKPAVVNDFSGTCQGSSAKLVCKPDTHDLQPSFMRGKPTTPIEIETSGDSVLVRNRGGMAFISGDVADYVLPGDAVHAAFRLKPLGSC